MRSTVDPCCLALVPVRGIEMSFINLSGILSYERHDRMSKQHTGSTETEWKTILDWYEIKEVVGAGSYGSVVKASCKFTSEIVAIKMVQNFTEHSYQLVKIIREI